MVKIIRLTTQSEDGSFETRFNSPVNIKADAKIALQNLIMAVQKNEIVVNGTNEGMTFQISGGNIRNAVIKRGTYDKTSAGENGLLKNIMEALNSAMLYQGGKELGAQWRVRVNTRINIQNAFSKGANYKNQFIFNTPTLTGTSVISTSNLPNNDYKINKNATINASSDNSAFTFLDIPICKGVGSWRAKIHTLIDGGGATDDNSGFILGLTTKEPSTFAPAGVVTPTSFPTSDIYWGIKLGLTTSNYTLINEGVETATTATIGSASAGDTNNDILDISMDGGVLRARVWYNGSDVIISNKTTNNDGSDTDFSRKPLYPVIIFRGTSANAAARGVKFFQDPYEANPSLEEELEENVPDFGAPAPPDQRGSKNLTQQFIQFDSVELAKTIGFEPNRLPSVGTLLVPNLDWTANFDYDILSINDNYQVIMDNVYLDSYDSLDKGQRNILAILAAKDDIGAIRYDSNYPIFVDANNKEAMSLKNIRLRVLRADGSQVDSQGLSTATLLIQD